MLQTMTTTMATSATIQFVVQLLMADGARLRPMAMMIGPVTTGGKNFMTFLLPYTLQIKARTRYKRPAQATPTHAYTSDIDSVYPSATPAAFTAA